MVIRDGLLYVSSWWDAQIYVYAIPEPASFLFCGLGFPLATCRVRRFI